MRGKVCLFSLLIVLFSLAGCAPAQKIISSAPSTLPGVSRQMKTAGYWIGRHPDPDKIILDEAQIEAFNQRLAGELSLTVSIQDFVASLSGDTVAKELDKQFHEFNGKQLYFSDGKVVGQDFFQAVKNNMNFEGISSEITVRFGFIVHYADQRLLPTDKIITAEPGDIDFDEVQNSALDIGTPVVILHESKDGEWLYGRSYASSGWVKREQLAFCQKQDILDWEAKPFVITLSPKVDIFLDQEKRQPYDYVQMGARLALAEAAEAEQGKILFPTRADDGTLVMRQGFVNTEDVRNGYLKYTPRNIIQQAFKLLNAPYGWGGMYGEQDCSRFLQEIFGTVGVRLPRNSGEQIKVSPPLASFPETGANEEKIKVLRTQAVGGITLLYMKGHIMLFLGIVDDEPYAIHAPWAYREMVNSQEKVYVINKVVVSNLRLGENSRKGSLLSRIKTIAEVTSQQP